MCLILRADAGFRHKFHINKIFNPGGLTLAIVSCLLLCSLRSRPGAYSFETMSERKETKNTESPQMGPVPPNINAEAMKVLSPLLFGHSAAMTLKAAVVLGIPDIIAKAGPDGTLSLQQIASQLVPSESVDLQALSRMMRALVHYGIFSAKNQVSESGDFVSVQYGATPASMVLVQENNPKSIAPSVLMFNLRGVQAPWQHFHETILYGKNAWEIEHGKNCWEYAEDDLEFKKSLNSQMASTTVRIVDAIKEYEGFNDMKTLVDVGGCEGHTLASIVAAHPHIHGINFDLPHVVAAAPEFPGVEHVGGSLLDFIPSGDAILMKHTMHLFDDETCLKILRNCKKALSNSNGKLLIYDPIIPSVTDGNESPYKDVSPEMDLLLLVHARGVDRTEEQWRTLLANGEFGNVRILHFPPQHWLIEACQ